MAQFDKSGYLKEFGRRLRSIRTARQMTLDELADKCGYTGTSKRAAIAKIENGTADTPLSKIPLLARALGVSDCVLFGFNDCDVVDVAANLNLDQIARAIGIKCGSGTADTVRLLLAADDTDTAEIRGELRQMLRADKYKKEGPKAG